MALSHWINSSVPSLVFQGNGEWVGSDSVSKVNCWCVVSFQGPTKNADSLEQTNAWSELIEVFCKLKWLLYFATHSDMHPNLLNWSPIHSLSANWCVCIVLLCHTILHTSDRSGISWYPPRRLFDENIYNVQNVIFYCKKCRLWISP